MIKTLRTYTTIEIVPRVALLWWGYYRLPYVHAIVGWDSWVNAGAVAVITLCVGLDAWRIRREIEERRYARYWADLRARHGAHEFDIDDDLL